MHSRRAPQLRHKGNRSQLRREDGSNEEDDREDPPPSPSHLKPAHASNDASPLKMRRKKGGSRFSKRSLLFFMFSLFLGAYIWFVLRSALFLNKKAEGNKSVGSVRGASAPSGNQGILEGQENVAEIGESAGGAARDGKAKVLAVDGNQEAEDEDKTWKKLVNQQSVQKDLQ